MDKKSDKYLLKTTKKLVKFGVLVLVFGFIGWYALSEVFAQIPPPATSICAIMPTLCPSGGEEPPPPEPQTPEYTVEKTLEGPPAGSKVKPGDKLTYKIKVTKTQIAPPSSPDIPGPSSPIGCLSNPNLSLASKKRCIRGKPQ